MTEEIKPLIELLFHRILVATHQVTNGPGALRNLLQAIRVDTGVNRLQLVSECIMITQPKVNASVLVKINTTMFVFTQLVGSDGLG